VAKAAFDEFKVMIDHAIDREELDDIRRMILEELDLTFSEKEQLSEYLNAACKKSPELRTS
jgi:hypothetical protein